MCPEILACRRDDADLAVRFEHYSDFGNATKPLFSLRWDALPSRLMFRASLSDSFRAPYLEGPDQVTVYAPLANIASRTMQSASLNIAYASHLPGGWTTHFNWETTYLYKLLADIGDGTGTNEYASRYSGQAAFLSDSFWHNVTLDAGIKNIFNKQAPFVAGDTGYDYGVANLYGRFFHAGFTARF